MEKGRSISKHLTIHRCVTDKVDLPEDATPLDFLDLLLNNKFYEHLTFQTNLCAVDTSLRIFHHAIPVLEVGKRLL